MKLVAILVFAACLAPALRAQDPVQSAANIEALFDSPSPHLRANKQVVYGILKDLLQANHWELADKYLTARYIQHNPNAASGCDGVISFFTQVLKVKPTPIPAKLVSPIVAMQAEGGLAIVLSRAERKDKSGNPYTTTWFDTWRIKGGKADEHWDRATKGERRGSNRPSFRSPDSHFGTT